MKKLFKWVSGLLGSALPFLMLSGQIKPMELIDSAITALPRIHATIKSLPIPDLVNKFIDPTNTDAAPIDLPQITFDWSKLIYDGKNLVTPVEDNVPVFDQEDLDLTHEAWQHFSDLDHLNRVGPANAVLGKELFPTEAREALTIKPTGWNQKKLSNGEWLYNRCHLIGFQLSGENNNMKNLMTGTRSFNTPGMLDYENQVMEYLKRTGNHVRYRVTPDFRENELVARGIRLEAQSIEDNGLQFNVYIFNVQEGYAIDYQTGRATKQ